jgi:hypothetical protein
MTLPGIVLILCGLAYGLGFRDGLKGRPPEPLRGTYDSGEHEDRVDEYGDWQ